MRFSIVIPTRNNSLTIQMTIESCLRLNYEDFEIIVQDNSSDDTTMNLVQRIFDPKVKYFRSTSEVHMTENWNNAIRNSSGDWVILLGGDDGIRRDALRIIDKALEKNNVQSLNWSIAAYTWENFGITEKSNLLSIPPTGSTYTISQTMPEFENLLNGNFSGLPSIYYGCIKRDLIESAMEHGPLLEGRCPDLFAAALFGFMTTEFLRINNPLTIAGFSNKSSVTAHLSKLKGLSEITTDARDLTRNSSIKKHYMIPEVDLKATWVLDSLLLARDRLGIVDVRFDVDAALVAKLINKELENWNSLGIEEAKILASWSEQWKQKINTPPPMMNLLGQ